MVDKSTEYLGKHFQEMRVHYTEELVRAKQKVAELECKLQEMDQEVNILACKFK